MHLPDLVSDLAVILLTGGVITVIFKKLNLPLVLGYILAGFLIGPYMPLFFSLADIEAVSTWSEIGIIILMFCLGLEFNLHKLASVGGTAIITALVEVGGMLATVDPLGKGKNTNNHGQHLPGRHAVHVVHHHHHQGFR